MFACFVTSQTKGDTSKKSLVMQWLIMEKCAAQKSCKDFLTRKGEFGVKKILSCARRTSWNTYALPDGPSPIFGFVRTSHSLLVQ